VLCSSSSKEPTSNSGLRGEYVKLAARLPGDTPVLFLRSELAGQGGLYARVQAARGLIARGQSDPVPAMIDAWRDLLPRLPSVGLNNQDPYHEAGLLIGFLATSGDVRAVDALGERMPQVPVDVRLAIVRAFLPPPKSGGGSSTGPTVSVVIDPDWDSPMQDKGARGFLLRPLEADVQSMQRASAYSGTTFGSQPSRDRVLLSSSMSRPTAIARHRRGHNG